MDKSELLKTAKPILFNTEMVRAILDGRKTVTRRVIKPQPPSDADIKFANGMEVALDEKATLWNERPFRYIPQYLPYRIFTGRADYLYVRETFFRDDCTPDCLGQEDENECPFNRIGNKCYGYKTQYNDGTGKIKWNPSIHMPKEAARIFLKVTGVRVERLQDITDEDCIAEGIEPVRVSGSTNYREEREFQIACGIATIEKYLELWNNTIKKSDLDKYGWDANPFVWVYEFERVEIDN